ncbi:MAG: hypothetical protein QXE06_09630 [Candidatus Bathyarchaeia archaeon]
MPPINIKYKGEKIIADATMAAHKRITIHRGWLRLTAHSLRSRERKGNITTTIITIVIITAAE